MKCLNVRSHYGGGFHLRFVLKKNTRPEKSHYKRGVIVYEKLRFQNEKRPH